MALIPVLFLLGYSILSPILGTTLYLPKLSLSCLHYPESFSIAGNLRTLGYRKGNLQLVPRPDPAQGEPDMETVRLMGASEPCFPRWWQREEGAASRATQPDCDVCQVAGLPLPLCCVPNMAMKKMPLYFGLWFPEHSPYLAVSCVGEREFSVSAQHPAWPPSSDSSPGQAPSCCLPPLASPPFQTCSAGSPGAMSVLRDKGKRTRTLSQTNLLAAALPPAGTWPALLTVASPMMAPPECSVDGHSQMNLSLKRVGSLGPSLPL